MSETTTKLHPSVKKEEIEEVMLAGREAVALSLDTTVYDRSGHRLDYGVLKRLEQFRESKTFLISEVVRAELRSHMLEKTKSTREAIEAAVHASANYWNTSEAQRLAGVVELTGDDKAAEPLVDKRIEDFIERCGAVVVPANLARLDDLVQRYFGVSAPFENSSRKKSEFPDAIALLSLEEWAELNGKPVIVVSADNGWKAYAETSKKLFLVTELSDALKMYQGLDARRLELVAKVASHIDEAVTDWEGFEQIKTELSGVDWQAVAYSGFDFDVELDVEVGSVSLDGESAIECLDLIDYKGAVLSVAANLQAHLRVDAQFGFSMDGVDMGVAELSGTDSVSFDAVLSFKLHKDKDPELLEVEIDHLNRRIDFGDVEPDHSLDSPDYEE